MKLVKCATHGRRTGYAVCVHIIEEGKPVRAIYEPDPKKKGIRRTIGDIVCFEKAAKDHTADELRIVCRDCAKERGWTTASLLS